MSEDTKDREGVDWHYGPDPAFGFMTKHLGSRKRCTGPDCELEDPTGLRHRLTEFLWRTWITRYWRRTR